MPTAPSTIKVFVNEQATRVPSNATIREAVGTADAALVDSLERGRAYVTDGVGRKIDDAHVVSAGAIYRVVVSARHVEDPPATA